MTSLSMALVNTGAAGSNGMRSVFSKEAVEALQTATDCVCIFGSS